MKIFFVLIIILSCIIVVHAYDLLEPSTRDIPSKTLYEPNAENPTPIYLKEEHSQGIPEVMPVYTAECIEGYTGYLCKYPLYEYGHGIYRYIHKKDLTALSFKRYEYTISEKGDIQHDIPPKLQSICQNGCDLENINQIKCISLGFDGNEHFWSCNSDDIIVINHKLESYNITCEYNDKDEVLIGSCSITYSLGEFIPNGKYMIIIMFLITAVLTLYIPDNKKSVLLILYILIMYFILYIVLILCKITKQF